MNIEEKTNEKVVEELAEVLAGAVEQDVIQESNTDATELEEQMKSELEASEEKSAEEVKEETTEDAVEDIEDDEASQTSETAKGESILEEPKQKKKMGKIVAIITAAVVVLLAGVYFAVSMYYSERFLMGTTVNGNDCSGMTTQEVEQLLKKHVKKYTLVITGANGYSEEIKGSEIGMDYDGCSNLKEAFKKQNSYLWPKALFKKNKVTAEVYFKYDEVKLAERIATLNCLKVEEQIVETAATVVYQGGEFVVQEETYGTQVDPTQVTELVTACVDEVKMELNLEEAGCYFQPRFTKNSQEVLDAKEEMNKYLATNITYNYDGIVVNLSKDQISQWISVDENMTPIVSTEGVRSFANTLSSKYNTANSSGTITTPWGKQVNMPLARYGRTVGVESEVSQIVNDIKEGKTVTREPIFSRKETPEDQRIWGNTYLEVDISNQHMWFVVNGQVVLDTVVITGKRGVSDTPTGVFEILEKKKDKTLRGRPGPDGKPIYEQPVNYWMRVTWSGIGFHDAWYRSVFNEQEYLTNGSHGCINMPLPKATELYKALPIGTPVVIHY